MYRCSNRHVHHLQLQSRPPWRGSRVPGSLPKSPRGVPKLSSLSCALQHPTLTNRMKWSSSLAPALSTASPTGCSGRDGGRSSTGGKGWTPRGALTTQTTRADSCKSCLKGWDPESAVARLHRRASASCWSWGSTSSTASAKPLRPTEPGTSLTWPPASSTISARATGSFTGNSTMRGAT